MPMVGQSSAFSAIRRSALAILLAVTCCAGWAVAEQPKAATAPARPELSKLRVGDHCRVWIIEPQPDNTRSYHQFTGDVAALTKHAVVLTNAVERKWSERTKAFLDTTRLSKVFPNIGSSGEKKESVRISRLKITAVEILDPHA
jgi:hypothetical protein